MPVDPSNPRFFIALLPPDPIQHAATEVIQELSDRFQMRTSNAPPHITLQAPFLWQLDHLKALEESLARFSALSPAIPIALEGYGAFPPRVLYIHVEKTVELMAIQSQLASVLESELSIVDAKAKTRGFTPHLTVASRNITRQSFKHAWNDLQTRSLEFHFVCDRLTLLRHDGQRWQTHWETPFHAPTPKTP